MNTLEVIFFLVFSISILVILVALVIHFVIPLFKTIKNRLSLKRDQKLRERCLKYAIEKNVLGGGNAHFIADEYFHYIRNGLSPDIKSALQKQTSLLNRSLTSRVEKSSQ